MSGAPEAPRKVFYTDAPEAYDYSYVKRTNDGRYVNRKGEPMYRVEMPETSADYQTGRYYSGLNVCVTEQEAAEEAEHRHGLVQAANPHPNNGNARKELREIEEALTQARLGLERLATINPAQAAAVHTAQTHLSNTLNALSDVAHEDLYEPEDLRRVMEQERKWTWEETLKREG